jgi:hypothetical protein
MSKCHDDFIQFHEKCREDLKLMIATNGSRESFEDENINLRVSGTIYKVKYSSLCKFTKPLQIAARGTTWFNQSVPSIGIHSAVTPEIYFSMPKFPNTWQSSDFYKAPKLEVIESLKSQGFRFAYMTKWDGSAIHIFKRNGIMHAYTLGSLNTGIKMQAAVPNSPTFHDLALKLFKMQYPNGEEWFDKNPGCGMLFEMCSRWNLIITRYNYSNGFGILHPLIVFEADGSTTWRFPEEIAKDHACEWVNDINDEIEADAFERLLENQNEFGSNPEGIVSYACKDGHVLPIFKHKRPDYLNDHHNAVLQYGTNVDLNNVAEAVINETYDDWQHPCDDAKQVRDQYRDELNGYLQSLVTQIQKSDYFTRYFNGSSSLNTTKAEMAKALAKFPKWFSGAILTSIDAALVYEDADEMVRSILLGSARDSVSRLSALQRKGCYWFAPATNSAPVGVSLKCEISKGNGQTGIHVYDWDGTSAPAEQGRESSYYEEPSSVQAPTPEIVEQMHQNLANGFRVAVVTGRTMLVSDTIKGFLADVGLDAVEVYCCSVSKGIKDSTMAFKIATLYELSKNVETIWHYEDDAQVLRAVKLHGDCKYITNLVGDPDFDPNNIPTIVSIVGLPASGKTTIATGLGECLMAMEIPYKIVGFEALKAKGIESREDQFDMIMHDIRSTPSNGVTFVDMCHSGNATLKKLKQMQSRGLARVILLTSVRTKQITAKACSGKTRTVLDIDPEYRDTLYRRAHLRIISGDTNGSSLRDKNSVERVIDSMVDGCIKNSAGLIQLDDKSPENAICQIIELML